MLAYEKQGCYAFYLHLLKSFMATLPVVFLLSAVSILTPSVTVFASDSDARFIFVAGQVSVMDTNSLSRYVKTGDLVSKSDTVETSDTGEAVILLPDGSKLTISRGTKITLTKIAFDRSTRHKQISFNLLNGKIKAAVTKLVSQKSSFEVRTATAVAGVRGTMFVVDYDSRFRTTEVVVLEGTVEAFDAKMAFPPVLIRINEITSILAARPPSAPTRVGPEKMNSIKGNFSKESEKTQDSVPSPDTSSKDTTEKSPERANIDEVKPLPSTPANPITQKPGDPSTGRKNINIKW